MRQRTALLLIGLRTDRTGYIEAAAGEQIRRLGIRTDNALATVNTLMARQGHLLEGGRIGIGPATRL